MAEKKTMKFKVLGAPHVERGKQIGTNPDTGAPIYAEVTYTRGQVVETDIDLAKKFNPKGSPSMAKFQRLADTSKPTQKDNSRFNSPDAVAAEVEDESVEEVEDEELEHLDEPIEEEEVEDADEEGGIGNDTLSSMTVAELKQHAASEGIDLAGTHTKAEILERIRNAN